MFILFIVMCFFLVYFWAQPPKSFTLWPNKKIHVGKKKKTASSKKNTNGIVLAKTSEPFLTKIEVFQRNIHYSCLKFLYRICQEMDLDPDDVFRDEDEDPESEFSQV